MSEKKLTKRQQAFQMYKENKGKIDLVEIANSLGSPPGTVRGWKSKDKWDDKLGGTFQPKKRSVPKKKTERSKREPPGLVIEDDNLTDAQKMFCLYYLQHFNATKAYRQAYQCDYRTANANAYLLMVNHGIKNEITRLKAELQQDMFVDVKDLIREYTKQAFADITDFVEVKSDKYYVYQKDERGDKKRVINEFTGEEEVYTSSSVNLKNSDMIDGTLIQEIKKGKDGVSIKLHDKQKAMAELMKYLKGDELRQAQINKLNKSMEVDNRTEDKLKDYFEALGAEIDGIE